MTSWKNKTKNHHLIEYILPEEDLEDLNLINLNMIILKYDFKEITKKYDFNRIL